MPVNIHGNSYTTVAERIKLAGDNLKSVNSEVLAHNPVVIKVTIQTDKGTFTGISAANPTKQIEKVSPYEVAETSALGRALGFSRYGLTESIASADEMEKANVASPQAPETTKTLGVCPKCGSDMKLSKTGGKYCSALCWKNPVPVKIQEQDEEFTAF